MRINEIDRRAFLKGIGAATLVCTGAGCSSGSKPEDNVQIDLLKIKRSWNSIIADIRITNINDFAIKDIKIQFKGYAPSGTNIDNTKRVIYQMIPSKGVVIIPNFDIGLFKDQVTDVKAVVLNLELINPQRK